MMSTAGRTSWPQQGDEVEMNYAVVVTRQKARKRTSSYRQWAPLPLPSPTVFTRIGWSPTLSSEVSSNQNVSKLFFQHSFQLGYIEIMSCDLLEFVRLRA